MATIMKQYANLHIHSTHSDGVYTPERIVEIAIDEGYRALSITDHDTYTANAEAAACCARVGLDYLPGIEFSTASRPLAKWFHMTAFSFDPDYPAMKEYLARLSARETHQTEVLFHRGIREGYLRGITWEEVVDYNAGITWLCNEHVFRAMVAKGLVTHLDYPAFFETVYGKHRAEVPPLCDFMPVEELIPLVHAAGGIIFLAHPFSHLHTVEALCRMGLDGIEVFHPDLDAATRREALAAALAHDLYVSGGSDHSGLCGGQYERYERPEETSFYFPPCTLGTTEYFFRELYTRKKEADRAAVMQALLDDASLFERVK